MLGTVLFLKLQRVLRRERGPSVSPVELDNPNEQADSAPLIWSGRRSRHIDGILESTGDRLVSPCASRTIVAASRSLSVPEMFSAL